MLRTMKHTLDSFYEYLHQWTQRCRFYIYANESLCQNWMRYFLVIFKHCVTFLEVWVLTSLRLIINRLLEVCWSCFGTTYTTTLIFSSHCTLMLSLYWIWWIMKKNSIHPRFWPYFLFHPSRDVVFTLTETTYWITAAAFQLLPPDDTFFIRFIQYKIPTFEAHFT